MTLQAPDRHHLLHVAISKSLERTAANGGLCTFLPLVADDGLLGDMKTVAQLQRTAGNPVRPI